MKVISTEKAPAKNWTLFTGNSHKRYGIYLRTDSLKPGDR